MPDDLTAAEKANLSRILRQFHKTWLTDYFKAEANDMAFLLRLAGAYGTPSVQVEPDDLTMACRAGTAREDALREAAEAIMPKETSLHRPCDCVTCICGNFGDAQAVAAWDEAHANYKTILALIPEKSDAA